MDLIGGCRKIRSSIQAKDPLFLRTLANVANSPGKREKDCDKFERLDGQSRGFSEIIFTLELLVMISMIECYSYIPSY